MALPPKLKQTIFSFAPLLNMVALGMMYGYAAILIPALLSETGDDVKADRYVASWLASMPGLSSIITATATGPLMHIYGRKPTQIITSLVILAGWILTSFAYTLPTLVFGRALQCLCSGCVYFNSICIGEFTCPSIRGLLLNLKIVAVSSGILIIHTFGYFLHWRTLSWVGAVPKVLSILISCYWPETPDWLVSKGRFEEAETVFFYLRGHSKESEREIRVVIEAEKRRREVGVDKESFVEFLKKFRSKVLWRSVMLLACAISLTELGGRHFFPSYSLQLAEKIAGDKYKGFIYTIILDIIGIVAGFVSTILIKRFPRRTLLFVSGYTANFFLLLSCFIMFLRKNFYEIEILMWSSLTLFVLYFIIVYGSTFGVCFVLMGEILPLEFRSVGVVIDGLLNCIIITVIMKITPIFKDSLDIHGMFLIFSICMLIALAYMYFELPETKDRTLFDIGEYFRGKSPKVKNDDVIEAEEMTTFVLSSK